MGSDANLFARVKKLENQICCLNTQITNVIVNPPSGSHPNYIAPTLLLTADQRSGDIEAGTIFDNNNFDIVFTQNDAGPENAESLDRNPGGTLSTSFPYDDINYQLVDGLNAYIAGVAYDDGPIKNNSFGVPDPTGRITSGAITSNTLNYNGVRLAFYGALTDPIPTNSAQVRSQLGSTEIAGVDFIINIPVGTVNVVFALPDTLTLDHVEYIELSNADVKGAFDLANFNVEGANAYLPIGYNVYSYTPVEPFPVEVNYRVKSH